MNAKWHCLHASFLTAFKMCSIDSIRAIDLHAHCTGAYANHCNLQYNLCLCEIMLCVCSVEQLGHVLGHSGLHHDVQKQAEPVRDCLARRLPHRVDQLQLRLDSFFD